MFKNLLLCVVLAAGAASAATYRVTLGQATTVKGTQLTPGDYKLKVEGDKLTISAGKQSAEAPVKVQNVDKKFSHTLVVYKAGTISEISIGGTTTKLILE